MSIAVSVSKKILCLAIQATSWPSKRLFSKVVKSLIKKIIKAITKNGQTDDINKVKELNTVSEVIQLLSPRVDEVFCCLYSSSLADSSVVTEGMALASPVEKLIQLCRNSHFCYEEDKSWLDFLSKALHHNLNNLKAQHDS